MIVEVDVVVLGMGPGGEHVAGTLAGEGLTVVGVEKHLVGGECPYYGCVPSKMLVRAADAVAEARRVPQLAGSVRVDADLAPVAERIRDEATTGWDDTIAADRFTDAGGSLLRGHGRLTGPQTVAVDNGATVRARRAVVLNCGTVPVIPPIEGLADTPYWTNRDAVAAERPPRSLVVIGGGAIGLELAQVFARFGTDVQIVEAADRIAPGEEPETSALLADVFQREGIGIRTGASVERVRHGDGGFTVEVDGQQLAAERLLVSAGRRAHLGDLGVDSIGLDAEAPFLQPDGRMRVADGVYAIGDVTGKGAFTHVSTYQAGIVIDEILGTGGRDAEYHAVPRVTFTDPEVGAVGMTHAQARDAGIAVRTGVADVPTQARGWIHRAGNDGFVKVVADADSGVLVGATAAGPYGGEMLSALSVAVHARVPIDRLRDMIYAYPTFHQTIAAAVSELSDEDSG